MIFKNGRNRHSRLKNFLFSVAIFSTLGAFSYALMLNYSGSVIPSTVRLTSVWTILFTLLAFNVAGFGLMKMRMEITEHFPLLYNSRVKSTLFFLLIAVILLFLNYLLLVTVNWLGGSLTCFRVSSEGLRLIITLWLVELYVVGLFMFNNAMRITLQFYKEKEQLKAVADKARFKALQSQLNPHFLFNSLNTLIAEIEYDKESAIRFTQSLSDVYRYVLQHSDDDLVTITDELEFLDSYVYMHQVRMGNCIHLEKEIPERCVDAKIPPMSLQLLAENVAKHNQIDEKHPMFIRITVRHTEAGDQLSFENKVRRKMNPSVSGKGLENLNQRYRLLSKREIEVEKGEEKFTVNIPLIYE